jgi:outer membrane protein TolC
MMKSFLPVVGLGLVALLAGCATARRGAREAQDVERVPPGERTVTAAEAGLNPSVELTVPMAIDRALQFKPTVVIARQNVEIARADVEAARAGAGPQIGGSAGYRQGTANTDASRDNWDRSDVTRAGLSADLLLYDFGKTPALIRAARARLAAAEFDLEAACNSVAYEVRIAFFAVRRDTDLVEIARETVRQFEERLRQTRGLIEVGKRIPYDLTKAEVDLGNARIAQLNANRERRLSRATLNRTMGLAEEPGCALADPPEPGIDLDMDRLMGIARERQPELRSLRAGVEAAFFNVNAEIANLYPSLGLGAALDWTGAAFPLIWNVSGALDAVLSLWDSGTRNSRIAQSGARLRVARARYAEREQRTYADLSQALASLDSARQRLELEELITRQARESLTLAGERFRLGLASSVELTDAQVALAVARAGQVRARFDILSQIATIQNTVGER